MSARSKPVVFRAMLAAACVALLAATASSSARPAAPPAPAATDVPDAAVSRTIRRALDYVYRSASNAANFREHGDDYMWCFATIAHTARDPELAGAALAMGRERARQWRREHRFVPPNATADDVADLVYGALGADRLGITDSRFKRQLRVAARRFTASDYLRFDPAVGPPPEFGTFTDALIATYSGDAYGIRLGAPYREVIRWLPHMRPYAPSGKAFSDTFYAVTHVVYTLNGYGAKRIAPRLLPAEVAFIRRGLALGIARRDAEMVGEGLDTLKAFGFDGREPLVRRGIALLVASQRPDGTWGGSRDVYTRYHSAWTGVDGLRSYRFGAEIRQLSEVPGA